MRLIAIAIWAILFAFVAPGTGFGRSHTHSSYRSYRSTTHRSEKARHEFERETGYPHGRHGYIIDHVVPLACGGADVPSNMQWQTIAAAKAKDKWERKGCSRKR